MKTNNTESCRYKIECVPVGNPIEKCQLTKSEDIYNYVMKLYCSDINLIESFIGIYCDNNLNVIGWAKIATGGISATYVDTRIIFKYAVDLLCSNIILVHNHPSGNLVPSPQDKELTTRIVDGGRILGFRTVDHLIVSETGYYSFHDKGLL